MKRRVQGKLSKLSLKEKRKKSERNKRRDRAGKLAARKLKEVKGDGSKKRSRAQK